MGLWARITSKTSGNDNKNHTDQPPAVPPVEPRMATDLGDALTAYWRNGRWWGCEDFIRWLINHGHLSEAAYALREVLKVPSLPEDTRKVLQGHARRLERLVSETANGQPTTPPPMSS